MLKRFEADEVLFREGDPSRFAILIHSGSADVLRQVGDDSIVLGTVNAGEWVGEMGLLEDRARSATVRAASRVEAELIERQAFLDRVSDEPELARKLLVRMSARLRDVEDMLTRLYAAQGGGAAGRSELVEAAPSPSALPPITLAATTRGAQLVVGSEPISITRLPFTVGRQPDEGEAAAPIPPDLMIPEPGPYRLSRAHFSLIERGGEIAVRDLASTLGTIVNDRPLGRDFPIDTAPLHPGENTIVAGGKASPFVFAVVIGQAR
ncbi:MAG TPA: cyclic nucleotide-binding domain-containing protein [Geminicoccaceae bacterium]|nr:cyclic nucleotide-binding domain-containing protein [Geminicoccaceae bacterium]